MSNAEPVDAPRILIADDDPVTRLLARTLVQAEKYQPVIATDGLEACRILQSDYNFSGAIFDMMMPHLEGLEITRIMKMDPRLQKIPVMMISAEPELKVMSSCMIAGVTLFLQKPFTKEQFHEKFQQLVAGIKSRPASYGFMRKF